MSFTIQIKRGKVERKLNVEIGRSISEFKSAMKEFELKYKLYKIIIRGKGLEFDSYRDYSPDDDADSIDWKASMRANKILARRYKEERNLKIVFVIDIGDNMVFGSTNKLKCEYAVEVISALVHLIISSGDKVGYLTFNDEVRDFIKPGGGTKQLSRLISDISKPEIYHGMSDINKAFDFVLNYINNVESLVFVSDFLSFDEISAKKLSLIGNRTETVALMIKDPLDRTLPNVSGELVIQDPRTGQQLLVNPKIVKTAYENISLKQEEFLRNVCQRFNIDLLELITNKGFVPYLADFLKGRVKRLSLGGVK